MNLIDSEGLDDVCRDAAVHCVQWYLEQQSLEQSFGLKTGLPDRESSRRCVTKMFRLIFKPEKRGITKTMIDPAVDQALKDYLDGGTQ